MYSIERVKCLPSRGMKRNVRVVGGSCLLPREGGPVGRTGASTPLSAQQSHQWEKNKGLSNATNTDVPKGRLSETVKMTATHSSLFPSHRSLGDKLGQCALLAVPILPHPLSI